MEKMVGFVKLYFPVFMLGAVFGKVIELSGFSESIVHAAIRYIGRSRANAVIVAVCALLTYGGVSLFVVVFAVYPFAAELYRQSNIPKRLMPGAIALGAFSFTMDSLPGAADPEHHPDHVLQDDCLGRAGARHDRLAVHHRRRPHVSRMAPPFGDGEGEGYGTSLVNEPERVETTSLPHPALAILPLILVGVSNFAFTKLIPQWYGAASYTVAPDVLPGVHAPVTTSIKTVVAIWSVELRCCSASCWSC